jgi:hypothetical protein
VIVIFIYYETISENYYKYLATLIRLAIMSIALVLSGGVLSNPAIIGSTQPSGMLDSNNK